MGGGKLTVVSSNGASQRSGNPLGERDVTEQRLVSKPSAKQRRSARSVPMTLPVALVGQPCGLLSSEIAIPL
jgi:hypothetical protein